MALHNSDVQLAHGSYRAVALASIRAVGLWYNDVSTYNVRWCALKQVEKSLRLSAGGIVIDGGSLLLVRHGSTVHGQDFLVAPGGGVEWDESVTHAVVRETREETGLDVHPGKMLFVEDMVSSRKRVVKFWFLCSVVGGELSVRREAIEEGIIEAHWYAKVHRRPDRLSDDHT